MPTTTSTFYSPREFYEALDNGWWDYDCDCDRHPLHSAYLLFKAQKEEIELEEDCEEIVIESNDEP